MLTLTAPWQLADVAPAEPAPAYLRMLADGLGEAHGWRTGRVAEHLAGLSGVRATLSAADIEGLLADPPVIAAAPEQQPREIDPEPGVDEPPGA